MVLFAAGACVLAPPALRAQTSADSAAIVLDAARTLQRDGRNAAARELLRLIAVRYPATPAARVADSLLGVLPRLLPAGGGTGRTGFVLFYTLYGGFLGAAIPAALGADGSGPPGAGLLIGGPLGYFTSRAHARATITMPGQAGIATFATTWGTWQGLAVQQVFDLGDSKDCGINGCYTNDSDTAPWAAMVAGGLAGLGIGLVLSSREIQSGTSTLVSHSAFWGSWFGLAAGRVLGAEDDNLLGVVMIGGNTGLLAAIPAARSWRPSSSRIRLTTAAGLAGGLAGLGIDLLASVDDDRAAFGIAAGGSAVGLIAGALATKDRRDADDGDDASIALVTRRTGLRIGFPIPVPAMIALDRQGRRTWRPGLRIGLLDAEF